MTDSNIKTVTVGVSALNEEANILNFISSALIQKEEGFVLEKVIVISDGSTDATVEKIESLKDPRIEIIIHKERKGQPTRMNELFQMVKSDILIKCDADTFFADNLTFSRIVTAFNDKNVGMVCASGKPYRPVTLTERAVAVTREAYLVLTKINNGNNRHLVNGRLMAFRIELARQIQIPSSIVGNDVFCYYTCLTAGFTFKRVGDSIVYYRAPRTIKEQIHQNTRFAAVTQNVSAYFPKDLIEKESYIPFGMLQKSMVKQWLKHPILATFIFIINIYSKIIAKIGHSRNLTSKWEVSDSSKNILK